MNLSGFDLNLLKVLDAMLTTGSTTRAADRVGLSQPAVSAALGRLRAALDDPLFIREGQGLVPTERAEALRAPLAEAMSVLETIVAPQDFDPGTTTETFRLSGSDFFSELLMPPLLRRFRDIAPGVTVQLIDQVFPNTLDALSRFQVDLAFWPVLDFPAWVGHEEVCTSAYRIAAPKDHPRLTRHGIGDGDPIPLDLYCDLEHVVFSPAGTHEMDGDGLLHKLGRRRRIVGTFPTFAGVYSAVVDGGFLGGLPEQFLDLRKPEGRITTHPPPIDMPTNRLCMIWHRSIGDRPSHRWLRQEVGAILRPLDPGRGAAT